MQQEQWLDSWKEGVAALDAIQVKCERMKHDSDVMLETLDREDARETRRFSLRNWIWGRYETV